jgi:hypothetical protein
MKKSLITVFILTIFVNTWAQTIKPIEQTVGKLHLSIDPRMELLSTIQILSNYNVINRNSPYSKDIQANFSSFSTHKAVALTDELYKNNGFTYDAPTAFMLYLSQVPELKQQIPYSDYLIERAGNKVNLENYRISIEQFAKESDFEKFWKSKLDYYNKMLELTIKDIEGEDIIKVIEDYFNETQNSYNVIIAPLFNGHSYGPRLEAPNKKYDIYSCNTPTNSKDGIPYLSKESLTQIVFHEFGHSFVNHETDKYLSKVESSKKLFEPIKSEMEQMAYSSWNTCINEHIIRAINVRIQERYRGSVKSRELLNCEIANRFVYIEPLVEKLKEFERLRDEKHVTFSDFYPQLLNVLDSLSKTDYIKLSERKFLGPINSVVKNQKVAWIYPTFDKDAVSLKIVEDYVTGNFNRFKSEGSILLSDSMAIKTDLSDFGLMVYGTLESNLFLKKYKETFPFSIKDNVIYADKEYDDENTKFITCLPNPQNPQKGMAIYTAIKNRNIYNINNVFHGSEDFIIFISRDNIITKGYYDKLGIWKYIK